MIDVCFLALGPPSQIDYSTSIIRNVEAQSTERGRVRYHLLVDQSPALLRAQMHLRPKWRGVPKRRVFLHTVSEIPAEARAQYKQLSRTATGPGPIYLYKPLLHLVLPSSLSHVIVLDTDLFLFSDIAGLWAEFAHFGPTALLGLAVEQCPSYQEVRALGGVGLNGGVQLLHLSRMRTSRSYAALLQGYMRKPMAHPMKPGGIGWLGDQTLYSWMSVNGTGFQPLMHLLPCGWNRQIGTHMAGWPKFWQAHKCDLPCHLLHGNYVGHKQLMESLKQDPTGASCAQTVRHYRTSDRQFRKGTPDARMLDVIENTIDKRPSHGVNLITEVLADALLTAFFVSGGQLAPRIKDVQHGRLPLVAADAFPTGCCCMTLLFPPCRKRGGSAATRHDHAHNVASWLSLTFVWGVGWGGLTLAGLEVLRVAAYDAYSPLCLAPWPYLAARAVWTAIEALLVVAGSYALWCTRGEADERSLPLDCAGHQSPYHVQHGTSGLAAGKPIAAIRSPFLQAVSPTATGFVAVD